MSETTEPGTFKDGVFQSSFEVHKAGCQRLTDLSRTCNCGEGTVLERPVSSQLSRIESGLDTLLQCQAGFEQNIVKQIAAVLEGQARLNALVDGLRQDQAKAWTRLLCIPTLREWVEAKTQLMDEFKAVDDRLAAIMEALTVLAGGSPEAIQRKEFREQRVMGLIKLGNNILD